MATPFGIAELGEGEAESSKLCFIPVPCKYHSSRNMQPRAFTSVYLYTQVGNVTLLQVTAGLWCM